MQSTAIDAPKHFIKDSIGKAHNAETVSYLFSTHLCLNSSATLRNTVTENSTLSLSSASFLDKKTQERFDCWF